MKEMPKDIQSNEMLLAMQNLLYDDTPENLAKHFNVSYFILYHFISFYFLNLFS